MTRPAPTPVRARRAGVVAAAMVAITATLLAGCAASGRASSDTPGPGPSATQATTASPAPGTATDDRDPTPQVPVASADLAAHAARVAAAPTPTRLRIDDLAIDIPLDGVGVAPDGQMEIPPMAERGGWYRFGGTPGDAVGTVVIAAHVDSVASAGLGPFARLADARPGQRVVVDLSDGTQAAYEVTGAAAVPKPDVTWPEVFDRSGPPRLVLITCGGSFRRDVRSYSDNILVTATPADA